MASWTAVRVRERGRFCFWVLRERAERLGRGRMRREARIRTWRSENFFSSSRVRLRGSQSRPFIANCLKGSETYRCWTRWKPCREGTGTKMTIAFLPWPTSIYSRPKVSMRAPGQALDRFPSCSSKVNSGAGSARARASIHHEARVGNHSILSNRGACLFSLARGGGRGGRRQSVPCRTWNRTSNAVSVWQVVCLFQVAAVLTSRAETICRGRRATLRSAVLVSRS